jgi:hypothetical protein
MEQEWKDDLERKSVEHRGKTPSFLPLPSSEIKQEFT